MKIVRVPYVNAATAQQSLDTQGGCPSRAVRWALLERARLGFSRWQRSPDSTLAYLTENLLSKVLGGVLLDAICDRTVGGAQRDVRRKWCWDFLLWGATSQPALYWGSPAPRRLAPRGASLGTRWNQGANTFPRQCLSSALNWPTLSTSWQRRKYLKGPRPTCTERSERVNSEPRSHHWIPSTENDTVTLAQSATPKWSRQWTCQWARYGQCVRHFLRNWKAGHFVWNVP